MAGDGGLDRQVYLIGAALFGAAPIQWHRGLGYGMAAVVS